MNSAIYNLHKVISDGIGFSLNAGQNWDLRFMVSVSVIEAESANKYPRCLKGIELNLNQE
jgi:hypothetical protein